MNFAIVVIKSPLETSPIVLTKDMADRLLLRKDATEVYLDTLNTSIDNILTGMGSSIGNVLFLAASGIEIDSPLEANTEKGFIRFNEPEQTKEVEAVRVVYGVDEIVIYYFQDGKTARRFSEKKILGEIYILNSLEQSTFPFYPLLREAYLFSSTAIEVGIVGFLDCQNTISAPTAMVTELATALTDRLSIPIENTAGIVELPIRKKYRLEFTTGSGLNVIKMNRGKRSIKDGTGNVLWEIHDEIFKVYLA